MILKVKNEFSQEGWFIIDNIAEISYTWKKKKEVNGCDRHFDSVDEKPIEEIVNVVQILVTFKDRHEEIWITEVTTFLLNDDGKTIEKIRH